MKRYAEGTAVAVSSSREEITRILTKYGVKRIAWVQEEWGDVLTFVMADQTFKLTMRKMTPQEMANRDRGNYVYPYNVDWHSKAEAEWRRIWRANVMLLKAKLEFIEGGDTNASAELLQYLVLPGGMTAGEAIANGRNLLTAGK